MTDSAYLDRLHSIATKFRGAIELAPPAALGITFERFPRGACGGATPLLGTYLLELGEEAFDYVLGERPRSNGQPGMESHAWLCRNDIVIDITADQFQEALEMPVIVAPAPTPFHQTFTWKNEHVADYRIYGGYAGAVLAAAYSRIKTIIAAG